MTLQQIAKAGITRVRLMKDDKPVWNPYSFGDLTVFSDGTMGPWLRVYDPCGQLACGKPAWESIPVLTITVRGQMCVEPSDDFEAYTPPNDIARFGELPPTPTVQLVEPEKCRPA
jgi:hypothetical protein